MDPVTENIIREEQVESIGRLMAGFSHDMKNHLGIIRESNGLMSDLIEMGGFSENETSVARLKKSIASIERRVIIAADMLHHLSSFAHRSDTPRSSFQINDLITEENAFLERFSRLKQINVTLELGEGISAIYNSPSLFHHVYYRMYMICLGQLSTGDNLVIITKQIEKSIEITFRLIGSPPQSVEELFDKNFQAAISKLEGVLGTDAAGSEFAGITLTLKKRPEVHPGLPPPRE